MGHHMGVEVAYELCHSVRRHECKRKDSHGCVCCDEYGGGLEEAGGFSWHMVSFRCARNDGVSLVNVFSKNSPSSHRIVP